MLAPFNIFSTAVAILLVSITPVVRCLNINILLERQATDCGTDPDWQPTVAAWEASAVDSWLENWWTSVEGGGTNANANFAHDLASNFGPQSTDFNCGIGEISSCSSPGCIDYSNQNQSAAPYLALLAVTGLNTFYNAMFNGITTGQGDVLGLTTNITSAFLSPNPQPNNVLNGFLSIFLGPIVSMIVGLLPIGGVAEAILSGGAGMLSSGMQSVFENSSLPNNSPEDIMNADVYVTRYSENARIDLQQWATDTFAGKQDLNNKTIIDYMSGGALISAQLPQASDFEQFYKKQMVSRIVQNLWQTQCVPFIVTYNLKGCKDDLGSDIPHYFDSSRCVQSVLKVKGSMGDNSMPYGWAELQDDAYNIAMKDIIISSVRSWAIARNNYTESIAIQRLQGLAEPPAALSLSSSSPSQLPTGSNDQCGSNYGTCATGYCCSSYGYCGSTSNYCTDCQPDYGFCPGSENRLLARENDDFGDGSGGVLYGPFSVTGNWSYNLVANESTPFTEGAAFEGTWQFPVCETTTNACFDLTHTNGTDNLTLCCGQNCVDTDLFKNATKWTTDPGYLSSTDSNVGELSMYGYCSDDQNSLGSVVRRLDLGLVLSFWAVWWVLHF